MTDSMNSALPNPQEGDRIGFCGFPERVSSTSLWDDLTWRFPRTTAGSKVPAIVWSYPMPDGSNFADDCWSMLRESCRRFIWSIRVKNRRRDLIKDLTLVGISTYLRYLVRWMCVSGYSAFCELGRNAGDEFAEYLANDKLNSDDCDEIHAGTFAGYIDVIIRIYEQKAVLSENLDDVISDHPFGGSSAHAISQKVARRFFQAIPPVPDDFFLSVVPEALIWIDEYADSITSLYHKYLLELDKFSGIGNSYGYHLDEFLRRNWPEEIDDIACSLKDNHNIKKRNRSSPTALLREMVSDLRYACCIAIQALLGIRVSELCGLRAGSIDVATGLPQCIAVRPSLSGLNEIFYVKGRVFKQQPDQKEVEWVAGSRPLGTEAIPAPVRAILALDRLFRPLHEVGVTNDLVISQSAYWRSPNGKFRYSPILGDTIRIGQKKFISSHVKLPESCKEWVLSTHQWRKSFAQYVVRSDERLLPAVSEHFSHLSLAMTEQGYLGNDPELLGLLEDVGTREAARVLFMAMNGGVVAGKLADILDENADSIRKIAGSSDDDDATKISRSEEALSKDDIRIWPAPWGKCVFRPETARCHHRLGGEFDLSARRPLYAAREPGTCCVCSNLIVMQDVHADFWIERHQSNKALAETSRLAAEYEVAAVAAERARLSETILMKLQICAASREVRRHDQPK